MLYLFYVTCRGVSGAKSYVLTQWQFFKLFKEYIDYLVYDTLRHDTAKFAHMNGHWKDYDAPCWALIIT